MKLLIRLIIWFSMMLVTLSAAPAGTNRICDIISIFPAGFGLSFLSGSDKEAPIVSKEQDCYGTTTAIASDRPNDPANRSNLASIKLDLARSSNYDIDVNDFTPGVSWSAVYLLTVRKKDLPARAIVIISDTAGNITRDTVHYEPMLLVAAASSLDFGKHLEGDELTQTFVLSNNSEKPVEFEKMGLQLGDQGFRVIEPLGRVVLGPKNSPTASVQVKVEYIATMGGQNVWPFFEDSVGVQAACGWRYVAQLKAQVMRPKIRVSDLDFGLAKADTMKVAEIEVLNAANLEGSILTVTGVSGPSQPTIFDLVNGDTLKFPFTLMPRQSRKFLIGFTPSGPGMFHDTIFFISNAQEVRRSDDYAELTGQGVDGPLHLLGIDWRRRRHGNNYDSVLKVANLGSEPVRISELSITGDAGVFKVLNETEIEGSTVPPGGQASVRLRFHPNSTGHYSANINFVMDSPAVYKTSVPLHGFGTAAMLMVQDYEFLADEQSEEDIWQIITIMAPSDSTFDSVTIVGIEFTSDTTDSIPDFRIEPSDKELFPIVLLKGNEAQFRGIFTPRGKGVRKASMLVKTNDGADVVSQWTGKVGSSSSVDYSESPVSLLNIAPNPAGGEIAMVRCGGTSGKARLALFDPMGNIVRDLHLDMHQEGENYLPLDISGLPQGRYLLQFSAGGASRTEPLVIVR